MKTQYSKISLLKDTNFKVTKLQANPLGIKFKITCVYDIRWETHQITQSRVLQRSDNTSLVNQLSRNTQQPQYQWGRTQKKGIVSDLGIWRQPACFFLLWVNSLDETLWHMMCHISKVGHQWSLLKGMDNRQIDMWMRWRGWRRWGGLGSDSSLSAITMKKIEEDLWDIMDHILAGWPSYMWAPPSHSLPPSCPFLIQHSSWLTNHILEMWLDSTFVSL